ncbi:uncharacterized protein LOC143194719 [Rhynchophorus ferrugineus]|uniref:uncharacterized protein LOC143194719 n=1 Tax=Rhynchophorus ferrugineus TaxID=354439 RepID=UPI003FCCD979
MLLVIIVKDVWKVGIEMRQCDMRQSVKFATRKREPKDHVKDCYFYIVNPSKRRRGKHARPIEYPDLESSSASVVHNLTLPVPSYRKNYRRKVAHLLVLIKVIPIRSFYLHQNNQNTILLLKNILMT